MNRQCVRSRAARAFGLCARVASARGWRWGSRRFRLSSFPPVVVSVCRRVSDDDRAERSGIGRSGLVWRESPSSVCGVVGGVRVGVARLGLRLRGV